MLAILCSKAAVCSAPNLVPAACGGTGTGSSMLSDQKAFEEAASREWGEVFFDSGKGHWKERGFLDGELVTVENGPEGMTFKAGPEAGNNAHHRVLWTKSSFEGDLKIAYEYTRVENAEQVLYCRMTNPDLPAITEGRIGLRHMFTCSARYRNFRIHLPAE